MTKMERKSRRGRGKGTKRVMRTGLASVRRLHLTSSNCVSTIINGTQKERSCWRRLRWWCWDESIQNTTYHEHMRGAGVFPSRVILYQHTVMESGHYFRNTERVLPLNFGHGNISTLRQFSWAWMSTYWMLALKFLLSIYYLYQFIY